jgi:aquaporin Z
MNSNTLLVKFFSEIVGTFIFILLILIVTGRESSATNVALPIGLALALSIYIFGDITGGHFNPAVSFAIFIRNPKIFTGLMLAVYILAQVIGSFLALELNVYFNSTFFK